MSTSITMYSADWCGDCVRSKRLLDSLQVSYEIINVDSIPGASEKVIEINGGKRSIPVILFPDGTHLTEPSDIDLKAKLEALKII